MNHRTMACPNCQSSKLVILKDTSSSLRTATSYRVACKECGYQGADMRLPSENLWNAFQKMGKFKKATC